MFLFETSKGVKHKNVIKKNTLIYIMFLPKLNITMFKLAKNKKKTSRISFSMLCK